MKTFTSSLRAIFMQQYITRV